MNQNFECDDFLIDAIKKGNKKAYSFLIDKFYKKLSAYSMSLTSNKTLTQDIMQNVFLNVWIYRSKLKPNHSIKNFLYTSVYNEFVKQYWKEQSVRDLESKYVKTLDKVVEEMESATSHKLMKAVSKEIEKLPPKCKKIFLLSKKDGLTNFEISEHLNISIKSVEAHISKAYSKIRKKIGDKTNHLLFLLFSWNKTILI